MSQEDGVGEGVPPQFLVKSQFAQFLINSQCFIPHAEFLKGGKGATPGKKVLERAGPSPAPHRDVTCDGRECVLGLAREGDGDLVLLPTPWGHLSLSFTNGRGSCCPHCLSSRTGLCRHLGMAEPTRYLRSSAEQGPFCEKMADSSACGRGVGRWLLAPLSLLCGGHGA